LITQFENDDVEPNCQAAEYARSPLLKLDVLGSGLAFALVREGQLSSVISRPVTPCPSSTRWRKQNIDAGRPSQIDAQLLQDLFGQGSWVHNQRKLALANESKRKAGAENVEFLKGEIEAYSAA